MLCPFDVNFTDLWVMWYMIGSGGQIHYIYIYKAPMITLYQPMMHIWVISSYENLYGGFNTRRYTLYRLFCFFKLFPMVGKGKTRQSSRALTYVTVIYMYPADTSLGWSLQGQYTKVMWSCYRHVVTVSGIITSAAAIASSISSTIWT